MSGRILRWVAALVVGVGLTAASSWVRGDEKKTAGKQREKHFEKEITVKVKLKYLLYLPDGYGKEESSGRWYCSCTVPASRATIWKRSRYTGRPR